MEKLFIEQTKGTPQIDFDPDRNELRIKGQSYPENAFKFYEPVLEWVDQYLTVADGLIMLRIEFSMPYINTSSSKCIMMLIEKLEQAYLHGHKIVVHWYYDPENESSLECAEEFKEDLQLPFEIIPA
ncbi:uncharacterized protein DUF1987 [Hydrogenispora ethanolica]|jgi:hypothetical protein|uniref:Uncharacterized protein DUF1987 n=1 Tax=Hydrogenispora ethanolica TaxID=1082276 RepID=A0A4R1SBD3_HYDET|nr:DUF1987 domain-containing protein [Hydrogenispora ethanolica]TCL76788.1 uncharacterized protein DUF1987 [Hydrogenispora ethanolica]